jgi:heterodisulfide reductase subunit B
VEYDMSTRAVFAALGARLTEIPQWVCCGASSAHAADPELALALPAVNLALAQETGRGDLLAPCAACFNRSRAADHALRHDPDRRRAIEERVGFRYTGEVRVRSPLEAVTADIGLEGVRAAVRLPLAGLRVVTYYGCLLVRPRRVTQVDDPEHPVEMQRILEALGAEVRPWSHGVDCCGGSSSVPRPDVARRLVGVLATAAREAGAQAMVTACPLCQVNLEMRQVGDRPLPAFYFTELMGLALGLPESRGWWSRHLVAPSPLLASLGLRP